MSQDPVVTPGVRYMMGDAACTEGALAAGCRFFAGYPITPATEIAETMSLRMPQVGGSYIQMEDELASAISCIGASYAGIKAMSATSGPGLSLMLENIGLAVMVEAPMVLINIMRGSPSTGQPTKSQQGDVMQAKWGSHGDYETIAVAPNSVQELFDLTIKAFNFSEQYRIPTFVLGDEIVGHLWERIEIPPPDQIEIINRKKPTCPPEEYIPFKADDDDLVPPMATFGTPYHFYATGLTHDEMGYPDMGMEAQLRLVKRLNDKIRNKVEEITIVEKFLLEDADIVVVSFGSNARGAKGAVKQARKEGIKAGMLRIVTMWPFPDRVVREVAESAKRLVVGEGNYGQVVREVQRAAEGQTPISSVLKPCGELITIEEYMEPIRNGV